MVYILQAGIVPLGSLSNQYQNSKAGSIGEVREGGPEALKERFERPDG